MQVVVIAFGQWESNYRSALISARTYKHLNPGFEVGMTVEKRHCPVTIRMDMDAFGIEALEITPQDLRLGNAAMTDHLQILQFWKIRIFHWLMTRHIRGPGLVVDGDTVCIRPLDLPPALVEKAGAGQLCASRDFQPRWGRYHNEPNSAAYVPLEKRRCYFNTGVLLIGPACKDLFKALLRRHIQGIFRDEEGRYSDDQDALNYLMNVEFPDRLETLGTEYNSIGGRMNEIPRIRIVHWTTRKYSMPSCHEDLCRAILHGLQPRTYEDLFPNIVSKEIDLPRGL